MGSPNTSKGPDAATMATLPRSERVKASSGLRKHFKGKMGVAVRNMSGDLVVKPRSHTHGGHSQARNGWTCDDTKDKSFGKVGKYSKSTDLSKYRVVMPNNRIRYVRPS